MAQGPIVRISREPASQARIKGQRPRFPRAISSDEQSRRHDAKFAGIETSISQVLSGADLSHSPTEVIPERALVFEVIGPLSNVTRFASAARARSEERRVGKECVSTCRSRWSPVHSNKKKK